MFQKKDYCCDGQCGQESVCQHLQFVLIMQECVDEEFETEILTEKYLVSYFCLCTNFQDIERI